MAKTTLQRQGNSNSYLKALRRTGRYHLQDLLGLRIKPIKLRIALTNRCNSRCIMCSVWQSTDNTAADKPGEITPGEIGRLLEVNGDFFSKVTQVSLTGGEPTLRSDLVEIVRVLTDRFEGRSVSFNSNGFNTKRILGVVEEILKFRRKLSVMISLDAMGEQHNVVRGMKTNVYESVMRTIEGLSEMRRNGAKLKLEINTVMTNVNNDQLLEVYNFCRDRKIHFNPIYITFGQLYQNQDNDDSTIRLSGESRARFASDVREIMRHDPSLQLSETLNLLENKERDFDCWAGKLLFLIEENGDVFPNGGCPPHFKLGNLRDFDFSFEKMLSSNQAKDVLSQINRCRLCQIPCEYMTTLRHAEALIGLIKTRQLESSLR